ncbi:ribosome-associated translation inhibitor RaiA [Candidatus Uhrbacteria bacterium]|jgi:ribosomal subunit interface protein|nr:ribosome-associated translation inhibitor RaiA [Candidatus Uhrbacteria bacterium]HJN85262.1 ribosome-associated translation inhibitor RaiA [Patescibacteria group bacterium]
MQIDKIHGKNMELTSAIEDYVEKRVSVLRKLVKRMQPAKISVEVGKPSDHHNKGDVYYAEFSADVKGEKFYASERAESLYEAIDKVQASIKRQIVDWKKKGDAKTKKQGRSWKSFMRFGNK